jgi:hypothetical protein
MKSATNPQSKFEGRRKFWIVALVAGMVLVCGVAARGLMNPFGGFNLVATTPTLQPTKFAVTAATPTPMIVQAIPPMTPTRRVSTSGGVGTTVTCWAVADVKLGDGSIIPNGAMVRVTGMTAAYGGLLETNGSWVPVVKFNCERGVEDLEKPYVATPAKKGSAPNVSPYTDPEGYYVNAGAPLTQAQPPRVITATPMPTLSPMPTATPINGVWRDGDCWIVNLDGVREIWMNGQGVSKGRFCNVNDLRVIVNPTTTRTTASPR